MVAALLVLPLTAPAGASVRPAAAGQAAAESGTWGVVPTQSTSPAPPTGALTLTAAGTNPLYFQVVNDGTVTIRGLGYSVTISSANTTAALTACSVAWTQSGSGFCPGTATTVGTWVQSASPSAGEVRSGARVASSTVPAVSATRLYLRATPGSVPPGGTAITINTSVGSGPTAQVRSGQTSNT